MTGLTPCRGKIDSPMPVEFIAIACPTPPASRQLDRFLPRPETPAVPDYAYRVMIPISGFDRSSCFCRGLFTLASAYHRTPSFMDSPCGAGASGVDPAELIVAFSETADTGSNVGKLLAVPPFRPCEASPGL